MRWQPIKGDLERETNMITRDELKLKAARSLLGLVALMLTLALAIACNQANPQSSSEGSAGAINGISAAQAADATATQIAFMSWVTGLLPQAVIDIRDHDPKKYAELEEIARARAPIATELALTPKQPHPIYTPEPTDTPGPSPTPLIVLGMMDICQSKGEFIYKACWRGMVNGNLVSVGVGTRNFNQAGIPRTPSYTDQKNGWVVVFNGPYFRASDPNPTIYETPPDMGIVGLTTVDNNVLTLIPVTFYSQPRAGATTYFDLATRQFLNAERTPIPTTPVP
jgi:hypothetical protein